MLAYSVLLPCNALGHLRKHQREHTSKKAPTRCAAQLGLPSLHNSNTAYLDEYACFTETMRRDCTEM